MNRESRRSRAIQNLLTRVTAQSKYKEVAIYCDAATHGYTNMATYGFLVRDADTACTLCDCPHYQEK